MYTQPVANVMLFMAYEATNVYRLHLLSYSTSKLLRKKHKNLTSEDDFMIPPNIIGMFILLTEFIGHVLMMYRPRQRR